MATAKYFAVNNNLKVNLDDRRRERIQGITTWEELSEDFGESQIEVRKRMEEVFEEILNANKNKRVIIVNHSTATSFLLKNGVM